MTNARRWRFWLLLLAVTIVAIYLLRNILLPFVAGMAFAYLLDPICDRLERLGLSRGGATSIVTVIFLLLFLLVLALIVPAAVNQLLGLARRLPDLVEVTQGPLLELMERLETQLGPEAVESLRSSLAGSLGSVAAFVTSAVGEIVSGGLLLANLLSLLVLTPIVTFFLLRDWDRFIAKLNGWLPRDQADTIRELARETDETLANYVRGVGLVSLLLGSFYALSLSLLELESGLVIGLIAGALTFIPYLGAIMGFVLATGIALLQFGLSWTTLLVAAVFIVGQAVEGNFLTPKLVGEKVGLHPVIVIFALLAGGALFGFTGVLLALPVAAVGGVMARYGLKRYLASPIYRGRSGG